MTLTLTAPLRSDLPGRVAAVRRTHLLDTPPEESFDRLTRMAARLLGAPVALLSLITDERQFFKSATGLPEPWATRRAVPLAHSICRHVVETGAALVVDDVRRDPLLRSSPAVRELGWTAYAGVPLVSAQGYAVGALSVVDLVPRLWSERDLALLHDLAACAVAEIELRALRGERPPEPAAMSRQASPAVPDLFAEAGLPMGLVSTEGRWVRVNAALAGLVGRLAAELVGAEADAITHPEDRPAAREARRLLFAGECASYTAEQRCLTSAGGPVWVLATVTAIPGARQLLAAWQDLSDRRAAESALGEREERYRLAAGAAADAIRDWDLAADRVTWGDGADPVFGWAPPAGTGIDWWYERIHPAEREQVVAAIQQALTRGERSWALEYRFRRPDGSWVPVADRGTIVHQDGEPVRLVGTMTEPSRTHAEREEQLRAGRYRAAVEQLRVVVFQTDLAGRWLLLNPAWEALTGFGAAETLGTPFLDYVHPDDRARHAREFESLTARRRAGTRHEVRYLTREGAFRWVEVQARLTLDEQGEPTGTTGTLTDQSERKRTELVAIGQTRLLEEIASGAALARVLEGIARFAEEHATPSIATLMLFQPDTGDLRLASAPRMPEPLRRALDRAPVGPVHGTCGTAVHRRERVVVRDIATDPLWMQWETEREAALAAGLRACWSEPILSVSGEVLGTFAIYYIEPREPAVEDVRLVEIATDLAAIAIERERAQEAVRRGARLLEQVLESLPVGVWVLGPGGRVVFGNQAGRAIWGEAGPAPRGTPDLRGLTADTGAGVAPEEWHAARALAGETTINQLLRLPAPDGAERTILHSAVPIRGAGDEVVGAIVVHQDISERQAAEEALRRSEVQLRQAQKMEAVGQLAGGIAHDFNNLLTGILSYCDLILQEAGQGEPIRADVEQIRQAGLRAASLTRQLLAFSRRQVLQPRVLSLNSTVAELDGMLCRLLGAEVLLETEFDPALWHVLADPGQIEQVLMNLAVNARDAMPAGGRLRIGTANRRVTAAEDRPVGLRPGAYVTIVVADTGVGMDPDTMARIFEPFFTTKEPGKGTGLGLSTVYGIVQQSGGTVSVESAPGQGSTFTVYLPRYEGSGVALPARPDRRALPGGRETLLLVEDEAAVRSSARRLLERYGYTVLEARHGGDALRIVEEGIAGAVDLVLTDLVMPEMGGRELVERLRTRRPSLKVLFMSGYTEKAITDDGVMPPHTGFVEKPFTVEQLLRRLRELLDG